MPPPPPQIHPPTPTLLLLSLPPTILCGINLLTFTTTPTFHGIKNLPPGPHFLFTSETTSLTLRSGFWFHIPTSGPPPLIVRKWDRETNSLRPLTTADDDDEGVGIGEGDTGGWVERRVREVWERGLSPYRQSAGEGEEGGEWPALTRHVTDGVVGHLTGGKGVVTSASCAVEDRDEIPGVGGEDTWDGEGVLGGLGIDLRRTWREGAVGRERTEGARDSSVKVEEVVGRWGGLVDEGGGWGGVLLGQMEVCFLMVCTVGNYSCLEEWKRCVGLVLGCRRLVGGREGFFGEVLGLLRRQLEKGEDVEGGLFEGGDEGGGFLMGGLRGFKRGLVDMFGRREGEGEVVREEMEELEKTLKKLYGWDLGDNFVRKGMLELEDGERVEMEVGDMEEEDESGEYAPVVVDLDHP